MQYYGGGTASHREQTLELSGYLFSAIFNRLLLTVGQDLLPLNLRATVKLTVTLQLRKRYDTYQYFQSITNNKNYCFHFLHRLRITINLF